MRSPIPPQCILKKWEKESLLALANKLVIEHYRPNYIKPPPSAARGNYIVDFSTRWNGAYLRFIAKYACPGPNAISPFFEIPFARLGYFRRDVWNLWARRHNDQWMELDHNLTLQQCFDRMREDPWFQP